MTILFVIRSLEWGGAERQLVLLANELGRRGHRIAVAVFRGGGVREKDLDPGCVRLIDLRKGSLWGLVAFLAGIWEAVRREKPDVVHGYLNGGNIAACAGWLCRPRARLFWGIRDSNMDMRRYGRTTRLCNSLARKLAFAPECIIVNSNAGLRHAAETGFPREKLVHVPNGVDSSQFYPDPDSGSRVREEWGITSREKLIGIVGRLDPMKGHPYFFKAARLVAAEENRARFACIGWGPEPYRRELRQLAADLSIEDRVLWLSERTEMRPVYNALDLFCSSSVYGEGFPNVLAEAMACGRPCVATDVGDSRFVAGDAARIVPARDPQALATALLAQLHDKSSAASRGQQRIAELFSVSRLADRTEAVLMAAKGMGHEVQEGQSIGRVPEDQAGESVLGPSARTRRNRTCQ